MGEISILRPRRSLVSIPVVEAVYCESCASVSNSSGGCCGVCGNISVWSLAELVPQPPMGAHSLAESIGDTQFVSVLDRLQIGSMTTIQNLEALKHLVSELEGLAGQPAA